MYVLDFCKSKERLHRFGHFPDHGSPLAATLRFWVCWVPTWERMILSYFNCDNTQVWERMVAMKEEELVKRIRAIKQENGASGA